MDLTQKFDAQTSNSFRQALCGFDRVLKEGGRGKREDRGILCVLCLKTKMGGGYINDAAIRHP